MMSKFMDKLKGLEKKLLEAGRIEGIETTIDRLAKENYLPSEEWIIIVAHK